MTSRNHNSLPKQNIYYLALTGLMAAVICILGPLVIPLPFSPVPVSLCTLAIYLTVYILGMKKGLLSCLIYLLIGMVGLPVFSGFTGGIGKLLGPTGGYLIGYLGMAWVIGIFTDKWPGKIRLHFTGMVLGTAVCYLFGTAWLSAQGNVGLYEAMMMGVLPFIPGDLGKIVAGLIVGGQVRRRLKILG